MKIRNVMVLPNYDVIILFSNYDVGMVNVKQVTRSPFYQKLLDVDILLRYGFDRDKIQWPHNMELYLASLVQFDNFRYIYFNEKGDNNESKN